MKYNMQTEFTNELRDKFGTFVEFSELTLTEHSNIAKLSNYIGDGYASLAGTGKPTEADESDESWEYSDLFDTLELSRQQKLIYIDWKRQPDTRKWTFFTSVNFETKRKLGGIGLAFAIYNAWQHYDLLWYNLDGGVWKKATELQVSYDVVDMVDKESFFKSPWDPAGSNLLIVKAVQMEKEITIHLKAHHILCDGFAYSKMLEHLTLSMKNLPVPQQKVNYTTL